MYVFIPHWLLFHECLTVINLAEMCQLSLYVICRGMLVLLAILPVMDHNMLRNIPSQDERKCQEAIYQSSGCFGCVTKFVEMCVLCNLIRNFCINRKASGIDSNAYSHKIEFTEERQWPKNDAWHIFVNLKSLKLSLFEWRIDCQGYFRNQWLCFDSLTLYSSDSLTLSSSVWNCQKVLIS